MSADALGLYAVAAAVSAAGSWCLIRWHDRIPLVDIPNARSSHDRPKPRSGGIALLLGLLAGCGLAFLGRLTPAGPDLLWAWILAGASGFFLLGLLDDLRGLPEWQRILVQVTLSVAVAFWGPRLQAVDLPGMTPIHLPNAVAVALTAFWYTGFVNTFNFMDGTDGMAAGEAVLAGLAMALLCGNPLPLLVSAAALGFLTHNYYPARIFMGDSGSYMLGYLLAVSAVIGASGSGRAVPFTASVLILGTFVIDATVTLLRRMLEGERWYKAHRSHHYQRLVGLGWGHARVFWLNLALTAGLSLSAFIYAARGAAVQRALVGGWLLALAGGIRWIHAEERTGT